MALKHIALRDFVIVHELELELGHGFTALTGQTGAGKSILIDALQFGLGARADVGVIREGAKSTQVSLEFEATLPALRAYLQEAGLLEEGETSLLLRRTLDLQGKSRAWVNGIVATATQLRQIGEHLLDIHGQHAWQSLTRPDTVRDLLDAYAQTSSAELLPLWQAWRQAQKSLEQARAAQDTLSQERERLQWQIGELEPLNPTAGQWDELNTEYTRLAHAQALLDAANQALSALEDEDRGVMRQLHAAQNGLAHQAHIEPEFQALGEVLNSATAQLEDVTHSLNSYLHRTELDPVRLEVLDEKMAAWMSLARRYKRSPEELPALLQSWQDNLAQLDAAADLAALEQAQTQAERAYTEAAKKLSAVRNKAAPRLARAITEAMQGLGMQGGRFEVAVSTAAQATASGLDEVEFLVSGHAGSTPRPVGKVASGGELSRIALAIAVTTSKLGSAQTLIFDEVDSGVGGAVAQTVGRLMKQLGQDRQVLAVTHLPQVAACADHHWLVCKQQASGGTGTLSQVLPIKDEQRVAEIARMLGGEELSSTAYAHATEMLMASV